MHRSSPFSLGAGPFLCFLTRGGAGSSGVDTVSFVEEVVVLLFCWVVEMSVGEMSVVDAGGCVSFKLVFEDGVGLNIWVGALGGWMRFWVCGSVGSLFMSIISEV